MRVIVYKPSNSERSALLARRVRVWTRPSEILVCTTPGELAALIDALENGHGGGLVLLLLEERPHLEQMWVLRERLSERRCVVVLSDFDKESLAMAHSLYPRFLASFSEPPERLGAILARIARRGHARKASPRTRRRPRRGGSSAAEAEGLGVN